MSRRSLPNDEKMISEMILDNISKVSNMNIDMNEIFNTEQMILLTTYKEMYNYDSYLSFFLSLILLSHCSQRSSYTHYLNSDRETLQLYYWLLGPSGSGKTHAFRQLEKAILKVEKHFPDNYLKPVVVNGKPTEFNLSSIVSHTNHIGLRHHLSSNDKILLNDDADIIGETYGLYNVNDFSKENERNLILCGFDGYKKSSSRSTGTTLIQIGDNRLTIALGTTGGKLMKNLKNWINLTGFDGTHNRFLYLSMRKLACLRPQNFVVQRKSKNKPSLAHLGLVAHLFGKVRYIFQMDETERAKFFGDDSNQENTSPASLVVNDDDQSQQQQQRSAMYTLWNIVADLDEMQSSKENQQKQITDFYGKAGTVLPRLVCLFQLYLNACEIFQKLTNDIHFVEGDNEDLDINENFINNAKSLIEKDYLKYDKTYLKPMELNIANHEPMVLVQKETVLLAWKWYEHHLNIAAELFTIDYAFTSKTDSIPISIKPRQKTLHQLIMTFDFNCFPISAISVKHPVTGKTGIIKNYPVFGEQALHELMKDNLIKCNFFLVNPHGRRLRSYLKAPLPKKNDPLAEEVFGNLLKHGINIDEYHSIYKNSSIPLTTKFSEFGMETLDSTSCLVPEYSKYEDQLAIIIQKRLENHSIEVTESRQFIVKNAGAFRKKFYEIQNLSTESHKENTNAKPLLPNITNPSITYQAKNDLPELRMNRITTDVAVPSDTLVGVHEVVRQDSVMISANAKSVQTNTSLYIEEESELSHNPGENLSARSDSANTTSTTTTQQTITDRNTETKVKKAMIYIMSNKSVIFTKTDLTHICGNSAVRSNAVDRLIAAGLLQHGKNYWVEPSRAKKNSKKEQKQNFREGWIKKGPESTSPAAIFNFLNVLQQNLNIGYDDYLKNFYPIQKENVHTSNSWFLSNEVVQIFKTTSFYENHVRWNIERFEFNARIQDEVNKDNENELLLAQPDHSNTSSQRATDDNSKDTHEKSLFNHDREEGTTSSTCVTSKRKAEMNEYPQGIRIRTQPKRAKKITN